MDRETEYEFGNFLKNYKTDFIKNIESLGYCYLQSIINYDTITITFTKKYPMLWI